MFGGLYFHCWNNEETCPECGVFGARLSEGLFNLAGEVAVALNAPDLTHAMLKSIAATAGELRAGSITPEDAAVKIQKVDPRFEGIFRKAIKIGLSAVAFVATIAGIYSTYLAQVTLTQSEEETTWLREHAAQQLHSDQRQEKLLEQLLEAIAGLRIVLRPQDDQEPQDDLAERHTPSPPKSKPPLKRGPS